jgi:peptide/nickel transport system substrate-binding protein
MNPPSRPGVAEPSRGSFLLLALLPGFALVLGGCGGDAGERVLRGMPEFCQEALPRVADHLAGFPEPTGERYGGTVVVAGSAALEGMNALVSSDYVTNQHQTSVHLMTLVRRDPNLDLVPYLAREWEMNQEGTEVVFHLRDDVHWHDGTPTTAHDVAFTYLRATDPRTGFPNQAFWTYYERGPEGVEVLDDHTVRLRLRPHDEALDAWRSTAILPAHLLEEVPPEELRQHPYGVVCPVGNGPFVFVQRGSDDIWTFRRNPAFPEELGGPPYLDRYLYRPIPEQTTLLAELLTGNVDVYIAPPPDQASRIESAEGVRLLDYGFRGYVFVGWNTRKPRLSDPRVRRALTMGTNRAEVVEAILQGYGQVANTGVPPFHFAHHHGLRDALSHDPSAARDLLDEAGWRVRDGSGIRQNEEGERLELSIAYHPGNLQREAIAQVMQSQLRGIGIEVRQEVMEWGTLVSRITDPGRRDFDGVIIAWTTDFRVDDTDLFHSRGADAPLGWAGIEDERLDELLETLPLVVDRDEALPLWKEYQERLVELQPFTYFYYPRRLAGVSDRVRGLVADERGDLVNPQQWWVPADLRFRR